jgi:hypothetical protein
MNILAFFVALVLFVGGLALMGYSFDAAGYEAAMFLAGVLAVGASIALPVHVLKRIDG